MPVELDNLIIKRKPLTDEEKKATYHPKPDKIYESRLDELEDDFHKIQSEFKTVKIKGHIDEINRLNSEIIRLNSEIINLKNEITNLNNKYTFLENELKNIGDAWTIDKTKTNGWILQLDTNDQILDDAIREQDIKLMQLKARIQDNFKHDPYITKRTPLKFK